LFGAFLMYKYFSFKMRVIFNILRRISHKKIF